MSNKKRRLSLIVSLVLVLALCFSTVESFAVSAPAKCTLKSVTAVDYSKVKLTWGKISKNCSGYQIYCGSKKIKTVTSYKTTAYTHTNLKADTTYKYKVRAYKKYTQKLYYNSKTKKWQTAKPKAKYWKGKKTKKVTKYKYGKFSAVKSVKTASIVKFDPCTIYEGNDVIIKVTGSEVVKDGVNIKIYIENNSSKNLGFNAHSYAVNGIMTHNNIYDMDTDVAAGKKANTKLLIKNSVLNECGIKTIKYLDILFWAYNNDTWFKDFESDVVRIESDSKDQTADMITGKKIYDKNGIRVDYISSTSKTATFVLTNTTGEYFDFTVDGISINDYTVNEIDFDLYNEQILNNCQFKFSIKPSSDFFNDNDISKIEKVDFYFTCSPLGSVWDEYTTEPIVFEK